MPAVGGAVNWFEDEFGFVEKEAGSFEGVRKAFVVDEAPDGEITLTSTANGRAFAVGPFETPSVFELRQRLLAVHCQALSKAHVDLMDARSLDGAVNASKKLAAAAADGAAAGGGTTAQYGSGPGNAEADAAADSGSFDEPAAGASQPSSGGLAFSNISGSIGSIIQDPSNEGSVIQVASQFNCLEMIGPGERPENGVTQYAKDQTQGPKCALACPAATVWRNYFWAGRGQSGGSARQLDTAADAAALLQV